jgi:hypothetical protein
MIKKILDWILGKSEPVKAAEAPYKIEVAPVAEAKIEAAVTAVEVAVESVPAVEVAPVTVKAKYKRAELSKMTKNQLLELVVKHGVEVKSRSTKEELIKVLVKV